MKKSRDFTVQQFTIFLLIGLVIISGCFFLKDESLYFLESKEHNIPSRLNESIPMRLNGYYYDKFESDNPSITIYYLYKNGIILYGRAPAINRLKKYEEDVKSGEYYERIKNDKSAWGVYIIEGSTIKFERWYSSHRGYLLTLIREGEILSDTTFHINKYYNLTDGKKSEISKVDEFYQFKYFPYKPDSTNQFIDLNNQ